MVVVLVVVVVVVVVVLVLVVVMVILYYIAWAAVCLAITHCPAVCLAGRLRSAAGDDGTVLKL